MKKLIKYFKKGSALKRLNKLTASILARHKTLLEERRRLQLSIMWDCREEMWYVTEHPSHKLVVWYDFQIELCDIQLNRLQRKYHPLNQYFI